MKISDIGLLKTELNRTDLKIKKNENPFSMVRFSKTNFGGLGTVLSDSQFILQHDRINSQSIFLHAVSLHF